MIVLVTKEKSGRRREIFFQNFGSAETRDLKENFPDLGETFFKAIGHSSLFAKHNTRHSNSIVNMRKPRIHPRRYPKFGASRAHGLVIIMHQIPRHFRQPYEEPSDDDMKEEFQGPLIDLNTCIEETKRLCGDSIYMQENTQFTPEEMESSKRKINERIDTLSAYAGIHPTRGTS